MLKMTHPTDTEMTQHPPQKWCRQPAMHGPTVDTKILRDPKYTADTLGVRTPHPVIVTIGIIRIILGSCYIPTIPLNPKP